MAGFLDITRSEFHKIVQISSGEGLWLVFRTFCMLFMQLKGNVSSWQVTHYGQNTRNDKAYKFIL
jgi:hypothetical protein